MPYKPTKKQYDEGKAKWNKTHPQELSYEEVMAAPKPEEIPYDQAADGANVDDRDWNERLQGAILNGLNIPTFGWGDDIVAFAGSLPVIGNGKSYEENKKDVDKTHKRYRELEDDWSPLNIGSGAAGFAAGAFPFGKLYEGAQAVVKGVTPAATTVVGRGVRDIAALGLTGGLAGEVAATAEGPGTPVERVAKEVESVANIPRSIGNAVLPDLVAPVAAGAESALPRFAMNTVLGGVAGAAAPKVVRGVQRLWQMLRAPENKAARLIAERMLAGGKTPEEVLAEFEASAKSGKPIALVDTAPESVRDVGTASARMPGKGRDKALPMLEERQAGQSERVGDDVAKANGAPPGTYKAEMDKIASDRIAAAKPLYEKAMHPKPLVSPKIVEVINRPSGKAAMQKGLKLAMDEGIPMEELVVRDAKGNIIGYTTKALHYAKMGIDDMISAAKRSGDNVAARQLTILKNDLLAEMDRLNPDYAKARKIWAGHSAHGNAMEMGRDAWMAHPDQIKAEMASMTEGEAAAYRQGFAQKLIEVIEGSPDRANVVNRLFGTVAKRNRIKAVIGEKAYAELEQRLGLETKMNRTYNDVMAGSQTAQRLAAQNEMEVSLNAMDPGKLGAFAKVLATGDPTHILSQIGLSGLANILQGMSQKARAEVVRMMFSTDPNEVRAAIKIIQKEYVKAIRFQGLQDKIAAGSAADDEARNDVTKGAGTAASVVNPF